MQIADIIKTSTFVYGTTRTLIPPTPLVGRNFLRIRVNTGTIFVGGSTVTSSGATQGISIPVGASMDFEIDDDVQLYGITASGTSSISILEGA